MLDAIQSLFQLQWRRQQPHFRPLPPEVKRTFVTTPAGELELLVCSPSDSKIRAPPIFFVHGGFGSAGVWLEWMSYLHQSGYRGTLYAYSVRNHGASYSVPYLRMVYGTTFSDIVDDFKACLSVARRQESDKGHDEDFIIVGHSSGGGLAQYALATGQITCRAMCLVDSIPHFGGYDVYWNWAKHDPWFLIRNFLHLQHPTSPLSSPALVHGAFFGHEFPRYKVPKFMKWMPAYESMGWPVAMLGDFCAWWSGHSSWLIVEDVLKGISAVQNEEQKDAILIMVGDEDVLMDVGMCERQASEYRKSLVEMGKENAPEKAQHLEVRSTDSARVESEGSVRLAIVGASGHHIQNDAHQDVAAGQLFDLVQQFSRS